MRLRRGFTLLETLVVLTLMGIVMAMAAPRVRAGTETANRKAARDVAANYASTARRMAVARASGTHLVVSGNALSVTVDQQVGTAPVTPVRNLYSQFGTTLSFQFLNGASAGSEIAFDKRGMLRDGVNLTRKLVVVSASGLRDSVCISGAGMVMRGACR